jgi:hypothetical protein
MANVIYRGPVERQPQTLNKTVIGALLPGTAVLIGGASFTQATAANTGRIGVLSNRNFYEQGVTDAYVTGETAVAYRLEPEQEYQFAFAAGAYTQGQELTVGAAGRLVAAVATNVVVAFFDQAGATLAAGDLADAVIANSYVKPA